MLSDAGRLERTEWLAFLIEIFVFLSVPRIDYVKCRTSDGDYFPTCVIDIHKHACMHTIAYGVSSNQPPLFRLNKRMCARLSYKTNQIKSHQKATIINRVRWSSATTSIATFIISITHTPFFYSRICFICFKVKNSACAEKNTSI